VQLFCDISCKWSVFDHSVNEVSTQLEPTVQRSIDKFIQVDHYVNEASTQLESTVQRSIVDKFIRVV